MARDHVVWDSRELGPEDFEALYVKQGLGEPITREEAISLCDAPAPMHLELHPYEPGPPREDRARILVRYVTPDSQIGRILVPDTAQRPSGEMVVIELGKGAWDEEKSEYEPFVNLNVGDRIVVGRYAGQPIENVRERKFRNEDGEEKVERKKETYTVLSVNEIMGIYR